MTEHPWPVGAGFIHLAEGDITRFRVDAIVNAANSALAGGGGVDGAIHRAGGPTILTACQAIVAARGPLPPGQAVATPAGRLPARHVIHTVGPIWRGGRGGESTTLANCYRASLTLAMELGARSVAFPSISTGVYGYPAEQAAPIALAAIRDTLSATGASLTVTLVLFSPEMLEIHRRARTALQTGPGGADAPPPV